MAVFRVLSHSTRFSSPIQARHAAYIQISVRLVPLKESTQPADTGVVQKVEDVGEDARR